MKKWNSAASRLAIGPFDEKKVVATARAALKEVGGRVSIGFVFASADYRPFLSDFLELLQIHGNIPLLLGCSGSGLIGTDAETENQSGFSLLLLHLPETHIRLVELDAGDLARTETPSDWHHIAGVQRGEVESWIALVDPFGFPVEEWLREWSGAYPGTHVVGGLCASLTPQQEVFLSVGSRVLESGKAVLAGFEGGVKVVPVVAQGCRPIGEPLTVTGSNGNLILGLGGKPAYTMLAEAFEALSDSDKALAQGNLFVGLASSEYVHDFKQGDFLIRTILSADADTGAIAVGAYPRVGQTLQWQLRDPFSAEDDLLRQLEKNRYLSPFASLCFACAGRGQNLFGENSHDATLLSRVFGPVASAGFFCNGEIGPAGGTTYVHGNSISIALFL